VSPPRRSVESGDRDRQDRQGGASKIASDDFADVVV
jgi:hypothetical protein